MNEHDSNLSRQLQLDQICVEFEEQLRAGAHPEIESRLAAIDKSARELLLQQLLEIELEFLRVTSQLPSLESLLARFPNHSPIVQQTYEAKSSVGLQPAETEPLRHAGSPTHDSTPSGSSLHGRFEPGQRVAGRYRIVSLLGKGGMGEVYRADDLVLGQSVALKFLPEDFANDSKRLEYFFSEVRLARQVSHPNVCRVHDIGEVDGQHFISMEFIDGEDLKALLKRTGRPQQEKAIEWARQLCSGLAAAHDQGVLHRDLKPANVMIDGRGQVRITDFGLATVDNEETQKSLVGTPAYMAPEQLTKGQTSVQSDVYSLGLVLFEIFAGVSAREANRDDRPGDSSHGSLSGVVKDIDAAVEQIVLRCLRQDPNDRPANVAEVALSLPGANPLAAALAAGQVPSPQLVATSEEKRIAPSWVIILLLGLLFLGLVGSCLLSSHGGWIRFANDSQPPEHLRIEAEKLIESFGYQTEGHDKASGYDGPLRLEEGPTTEISYWYRQRPEPFVVIDHFQDDGLSGYNLSRVRRNQPAWKEGDVGIQLSPQDGQLRWFRAKPNQRAEKTVLEEGILKPKELDLTPDRVGFDFDALALDHETSILPPDYADVFQTWRGKWPSNGNEFQVTVAQVGGNLSYFQLRSPSDEYHSRTVDDVESPLGFSVGLTLMLFASSVALFLLFNNLWKDYGDKVAALRLSLSWFTAGMVCWALQTHSFQIGHIVGARNAMAGSAFAVWVFYISFEPFVRRNWPELLVGTTNLLRANALNPSVGREILVGSSVGAFYTAGILLMHRFMGLHSPGHVIGRGTNAIVGTPEFLSWVIGTFLFSGVLYAVVFLAGLVALRLIFRTKLWTGVAATILLGLVMSGGIPSYAIPIRIAWLGLMYFVLLRHGLLALIVFRWVEEQLQGPVTSDIHAEFFGRGMLVLSYIFLIGFVGAGIWSGLAQLWFHKLVQRSQLQ